MRILGGPGQLLTEINSQDYNRSIVLQQKPKKNAPIERTIGKPD
jgi:hypothetical protein